MSEFLSDPAVELVGYQANFQHLELGLILFNHRPCRSTLGVPVEAFESLVQGPKFQTSGQGKRECPGSCFQRINPEQCPAECECRWVRDLLEKLRTRMARGS